MTQYLSKFTYGEKFERLPDRMELNARGYLCLMQTKIDMVPAGLKGVFFIFMADKPRYIAPDFKGIVLYGDFKDMDNLDIQEAKARYVAEREKVEKPRFIQEKDGSLSLCSLPTNMHVFYKQFEGYCLDLTQTSVTKTQNLGGFKEVILEPKKIVQQEFPFVLPMKLISSQRPKIMAQTVKTRA